MKPRGTQTPYTSGISDISSGKPNWIPQSRAGAVNMKHHVVVAWKLPDVKSKNLAVQHAASARKPQTRLENT